MRYPQLLYFPTFFFIISRRTAASPLHRGESFVRLSSYALETVLFNFISLVSNYKTFRFFCSAFSSSSFCVAANLIKKGLLNPPLPTSIFVIVLWSSHVVARTQLHWPSVTIDLSTDLQEPRPSPFWSHLCFFASFPCCGKELERPQSAAHEGSPYAHRCANISTPRKEWFGFSFRRRFL